MSLSHNFVITNILVEDDYSRHVIVMAIIGESGDLGHLGACILMEWCSCMGQYLSSASHTYPHGGLQC
jgi:hypothetical protein